MKRFQQILIDYANETLNSPALIDVKTVHRPKLKLIVQAAFFDGMNFMAKQYNKALQKLDSVLDEEVGGEEPVQEEEVETPLASPEPDVTQEQTLLDASGNPI